MKNKKSIAFLAAAVCSFQLSAQQAFDVKNHGSLMSQKWAQTVIVKTYPDSDTCSANGVELTRHHDQPAFVYTSFPEEGDAITISCRNEAIGELEVKEEVYFDKAYYKKIRTANAVGGFVGGGVGGLVGAASVSDIPFSYYYPGLISLIYEDHADDEKRKEIYFSVKEDWRKIYEMAIDKKQCGKHKERRMLCAREELVLAIAKAGLDKVGYVETEADLQIPFPSLSFREEEFYWLQKYSSPKNRLRVTSDKITAACMQVRFTINASGLVEKAKIAKIYPVDKKLASDNLKMIRNLKFEPTQFNFIRQPVETNRVMVHWDLPPGSMSKKKYRNFKDLIYSSCSDQ